MAENIENAAEAKENMESPAEVKVPMKERIKNSRPVKGIKKHWKGAIAGAAGAAAIIGAALAAGKLANDQLLEVPFDADTITDAVPDIGAGPEA